MTAFIKPKVLQNGSIIGIVASSSSFSEKKFNKGLEVLKSLGFQIKYGVDMIGRKSGYLAGSDDVRTVELSAMLTDPEIEAIMFARGGYGIQRIINHLDFSECMKNPKLIIGYSDLTALTSYITTKLNTVCLYGPVVTALATDNEVTISSLNNALTSKKHMEIIRGKSLKVIKEGEASGKLLGGCLSILSSSVGTDYELNTNGSILFIEDFNEQVYKYDRMLTHLKNSGALKQVKGIIFGPMGLVKDEQPEQLWDMVSDVLSDFSGPVLYGLNSGHSTPFLTLPLGVECRLIAHDTGHKTQDAGLSFIEAALC